MRILKKIISLEPYKSRQCGIIPSYESGYDTIMYYNPQKDNFSNYGSFPLNVIYDNKCLPYSDLMDRYHFCKKYIDLLTKNHNCRNIKYTSAMEYFIHEVQYKTIELEEEYKEMDNLFVLYGGNDFINFCEAKCFPLFVFSQQFNDVNILNAWHINRMSFLDIKRWIKKLEYLKNSQNECDKCKYEELYGDEVLAKMKTWLNGLSAAATCNDTCFNIPILFTTSIENLGEFTIFSKEWEEGKDYRPNGASVIYNEEIYELTSGTGSKYDPIYKENNFDVNGWKKKEIKEVIDVYKKLEPQYALKDGIKVENPSKNNMYYEYKIDFNDNLGFFYIKGNLYRVFESEYIIINGKYFLIKTFESSNFKIKKCVIDGVTYYSYFENDSHKINYNGEIITLNDNKKEFILIDNILLPITNDKIVLIDKINECNVTYNKFEGIIKVDGVDIFIDKNKSIKFTRKQDENSIHYEYINDSSLLTYVGYYYTESKYNKERLYEIDGNILKLHKPYMVYNPNIISGYTESKLSLLIDYNLCYDDMGNKLPCSLKKNDDGNYIQPSSTNNIMDIVHHVGNVSQISKLDEELYWGNIITDITYYYKDAYGNKVCTSKTIDETNELFENFNGDINTNLYVNDELMCDITYYIGAFLSGNNNTYSYKEKGVKYIDSIKLIKSSHAYYTSDVDSFMIEYYKYEYDVSYVINNEYGNSVVNINIGYFEVDKEDQIEGLICDHIFREEYKLGIASKEKLDIDVYIDRGIASAFEKHLKILDVSSMESLENMGNGYFNILKN